MKIAYIVDDNISIRTGVSNKIELMINEWKALGHDVKVYSLRSQNFTSIIEDAVVVSEFKTNISKFTKFTNQAKNITALEKYLKEYSPDIIYIRNMKYYFNFVSVLKRTAPYIVEINSKDIEESKLNNQLVYYYNKLTRGILLNNASAFVSVSHELINDDAFAKFNKPFTVIGNGYNFSDNNMKKRIFNTNIKFVFIGTPHQIWHGIDTILNLSKVLTNNEFHIIGFTKNELLEIDCNFKSNVFAHGYLKHNESEEIIKNCDIGISTLGLYKKNMQEASPLKSRQYLSLGLPIIIGYDDTDISNEKEYILNIGNYEKSVDDNVNKIKDFMNNIEQLDIDTIIEDAKGLLNYQEKEVKRIEYFKKIINLNK